MSEEKTINLSEARENRAKTAEIIMDLIDSFSLADPEKGGRGRELSADERAGILRAFSSRGKSRGFLKSKAPSPWDDVWGAAAWQGIQPNPFKLGISSGMMIMHRDEDAGKFMNWLMGYRFPGFLDKDRETLARLGAW